MTDHTEFAKLARLYPRDGQIGRGSMMVAFEASGIFFVATLVIAFLMQCTIILPKKLNTK